MSETRAQLPEHIVIQLTSRLALLDELRLPTQMTKGRTLPSTSQREEHLKALLRHDPGVFLERYGELLATSELQEFTALRSDYEVNFYLTSLLPSQPSDLKKKDQTVKRRRMAYLETVLLRGDFFSEENMRERAPWMYEEYVGTLTDSRTDNNAQNLSDWFMHRHNQMQTDEKLQREKASQQFSESEEEEEDSSDEDDVAPAADPTSRAQRDTLVDSLPPASEEGTSNRSNVDEPQPSVKTEEELRLGHEFVELMKQRFLAGQDKGYVDYAEIDANSNLDDFWLAEKSREAEEKYFDE